MRTWLESHVRFGVSRLGPGSSWGGRASAHPGRVLAGGRRPGPGRRRDRAGGVGGAGRAASGAWPPEGAGLAAGGQGCGDERAGARAEAARAGG